MSMAILTQSILLLLVGTLLAGAWWVITLPIKLAIAQARNLKATTDSTQVIRATTANIQAANTQK